MNKFIEWMNENSWNESLLKRWYVFSFSSNTDPDAATTILSLLKSKSLREDKLQPTDTNDIIFNL